MTLAVATAMMVIGVVLMKKTRLSRTLKIRVRRATG